MAQTVDGNERTAAELEAQRAAEQEALRRVRRLTDALEQEQRDRRRMARWGGVIAVAALVVLGAIAAAIYLKSTDLPPPAKIDVPGKVAVPGK